MTRVQDTGGNRIPESYLARFLPRRETDEGLPSDLRAFLAMVLTTPEHQTADLRVFRSAEVKAQVRKTNGCEQEGKA